MIGSRLSDKLIAIVQPEIDLLRAHRLGGGVCVARTTIRHTRRAVRRCAFWHGGVCRRWVVIR